MRLKYFEVDQRHPSNPLLRLIHPALLFYLSLVFLLGALDT